MSYTEGRVPVSWKCYVLNKVVNVEKNAVFHGRSGWICDCGRWMRDGDAKHTIARRDIRTVYIER
jgi:hypothetical protein